MFSLDGQVYCSPLNERSLPLLTFREFTRREDVVSFRGYLKKSFELGSNPRVPGVVLSCLRSLRFMVKLFPVI